MRPSAIYFWMFILSYSIFGGSCNQEEIFADLTINDWIVNKIQRDGSDNFEYTDSIYFVKFKSDLTFTLSLDVNSCSGKYTISKSGDIILSDLACTEACCDSEYAEAIIQLLPKIKKYSIVGGRLYLEGDGIIVLDGVIHEACYDMPPTGEVCAAYFERWFYNESSSSCQKIAYSGCSEYGFATKGECEACRVI